MAEAYVTLNEAAELENVGYETMKKGFKEHRKSFM